MGSMPRARPILLVTMTTEQRVNGFSESPVFWTDRRTTDARTCAWYWLWVWCSVLLSHLVQAAMVIAVLISRIKKAKTRMPEEPPSEVQTRQLRGVNLCTRETRQQGACSTCRKLNRQQQLLQPAMRCDEGSFEKSNSLSASSLGLRFGRVQC